jgi:hypothetical protein
MLQCFIDDPSHSPSPGISSIHGLSPIRQKARKPICEAWYEAQLISQYSPIGTWILTGRVLLAANDG